MASKVAAKKENPLFRLYKDTRSELKKVVWPTREEVIKLTMVVIALSIAVGATLGLADYIFLEFYKFLAP
ncbi:MAG: preprotein translocase subunit SecE [Chloroflexi bacterium]|nr:preprotein translocase subunit SecE [Chloroflexota bacterium]